MAILRFPCPQCQRVLKVGDQFSGRQAKCPGCQTAVTVPQESDLSVPEAPTAVASAAPRRPAPAPAPRAAASPAPHFDFDDDTAAAAPQESWEYEDANDAVAADAAVRAAAGAWKSVRTGIRLLQISVYLRIGAVVVFTLAMVVMLLTSLAYAGYLMDQVNANPGVRNRSNGAAEMSLALLLLFLAVFALVGLSFLAAEILKLIGAILMLQAPEVSGAKGFAIAALISQIVLMAGPFLSCAGGMAQVSAVNNVSSLLQMIASVTWIVMVLLFIHKVGSYLKSEALCREVVSFAIWIGVSIGIGVGSFCLLTFVIVAFFATAISTASNNSRGAASEVLAGAGWGTMVMMVLFALVVVGLAISLLVKFLQLLTTTQDVITRRAIRASAA